MTKSHSVATARRISRRVFHRNAIATAAAASCTPWIIADDRTNGSPLRLGKGKHTYIAEHDWLKPPTGIAWGDTHGVAQDRAGNIYVAHTVGSASDTPHAVCAFDADGKFVSSWGERYRGGAHGLDLRREGSEEFLYHCDTRARCVVKTNLAGEVVWERTHPVESGVYETPERYCPTNVAFAPNGDLFVGDGYGSSYIHRYSPDGDFRATIAKPGSGPGEVSCPHGLWVDTRVKDAPELVVADRSNRRLQRLTLDGTHIGFVTDGMRQPCDVDFRGDYALVPDLSSVITILNRDYTVAAHLGDGDPTSLRGKPRSEFIPGKFIHPHDAIWLKDGSILVAEWVPNGRITRLRHVDA